MADITLEGYLTIIRGELHLLGIDDSFRGGYTGDPENSSNPNSVSLTAKLNEAIAEVQLEFGFSKAEGSITTASGTREYVLPSGVETVESVHCSNLRLRSTTVKNKDAIKYSWRLDNGVPKQYYMVGANKIGFYPNPNAILTVKVYGLASSTQLAATTDVISQMPEPYQYIFPIRAALNIAAADTGSEMNQDRLENLKGRYATLSKNLADYLGVVSTDENAAIVVAGRGQSATASDV